MRRERICFTRRPPQRRSALTREPRELLARAARFRFRGFAFCAPRALAFRGFLHRAHVRQVLGSARSKLGGDQIVLRNKERLEAALRVNHAFDPPLPCGVKINARKIGKNIHASWIASKTKEAGAVCELLRPNAFQRYAEFGKRRVSCLRVPS